MALLLKPKRLIQNGLVAHYAPIRQRNLLKWSEDFSNSAWTKGTGVTVESNVGIAPDGTLTADKVSYNGSGVMDGTKIYNAVIPTAIPSGIKYAVSIWIRSDIPLTMRLHPNIPGSVTINITTEWKRFSAIGTGNNVAYLIPNILSMIGDNNPFDIYVWGAQVELGSQATTYQRTTDLQTLWNQKQENMSVANIVTNGNFVNTDGWSPTGVNISTLNNTLIVTANGTSANPNILGGNNGLSYSAGTKLYGICRVKVPVGCIAITFNHRDTTSAITQTIASISSPPTGVFLKLSGVYTLSTNSSYPRWQVVYSYPDTATANEKVSETKEILVINLTNLFELPTTQQCDEIFSSWFDGSIRMNLNRYNGMLGSTSAVDTNDPTYDGTGLSFGGDDYVGIGNIGKEMRTCQIVFYTPSVINKDSVGQTHLHFSGVESFTGIFLGAFTPVLSDEIITISSNVGGWRVGWCSSTDILSVGWHILEFVWDGTKYRIILDGVEKNTTVYASPAVINITNLLIGKMLNSTLYFTGKQAEIFISDRSLTDAELAKNRAYFRQECARLGVMLP